jgi:capsular exopolysaccharide synthesis family protein
MRFEAPAEEGVPWARYVAACLRYKWLILLMTLAGVGAGVVGSRLIEPEYQTSATIWISESGTGEDRGPIRASELLSARAWPELLRSFSILEKVVQREKLYLEYENPADSALFAGFGLAERIRPGAYELRVSPDRRFRLLASQRLLVDSGTVGDSIGRTVGFRWQPVSEVVPIDSQVSFRVNLTRAAAFELRERVGVTPNDRTNLLGVTLRDKDPERAARTLNVLLEEFVATAAELKKRSLVENAGILGEQLDYAYRELQAAEVEYETFRVSTITLPSEGTAVVAGVELTRDPVFSSYFEQRVELDRTRRDLSSLDRFLRNDAGRSGDLNVLWGIPAVETYGDELRSALSDYASKEAAWRSMLAVYTAEHPSVRESKQVLDLMRTQVVLPLIHTLAGQLREREQDIERRLGSTAQELRQIPQRTIEEMRLRRNVDVRENLYTLLKNRFEEARLAEASSLPDVSVLDQAAAPQNPTRNTAPRVIAMATAAGFGLAILLTLLLDRMDPRVRYPEQITHEMRLGILGAIPTLSKRKGSELDVREAFQVVEAFRSIRLSLFHALGGHHPIQFAVSSPGIGDGKSLVSANLALSFAEVGYSTILVDGDIRRGGLHAMFGTERRPGLLDHLAGDASLESVLQPTGHKNLTLLASGSRSQHGPELLMGPGLARLMASLRGRFHVVVIDTPPLGASIDPFALGSAAENMLLVVRSGETDRKMALAKLEMLDRLPIRMLGVVLNDIRASGVYKYYSYLDGYASDDEPSTALAGPGKSERWS